MSYVRNILRAAPRTLTAAQQGEILKVTGEHVDGFRDHVILSLALGTALREGEIAALNVGDVARPLKGKELERFELIRPSIHLRVFKRSAHGASSTDRQQVFLPRAVRRKLEKFLGWKRRAHQDLRPGAPLFISRFGSRISTRQLRNMFAAWQARAGFERRYNFHGLRHTALTNLYACTKDLLLVQKAARHAHASTTEIYTHASDEDLRQAVEELPS